MVELIRYHHRLRRLYLADKIPHATYDAILHETCDDSNVLEYLHLDGVEYGNDFSNTVEGIKNTRLQFLNVQDNTFLIRKNTNNHSNNALLNAYEERLKKYPLLYVPYEKFWPVERIQRDAWREYHSAAIVIQRAWREYQGPAETKTQRPPGPPPAKRPRLSKVMSYLSGT